MRHLKLILLLFFAAGVMAGQPLTNDQAENYLQSESSDTVMSFGGPRPADASAMEITIVTPDGNRITRLSGQSWVDIDLGKNVGEGIYHYEVIYSIPTDTVVITPRGELKIPQETVRSSGFFRIHNGVIVENENQLEIQRPNTTHPNASNIEMNPLMRGLVKVLDWLTPSAQAANTFTIEGKTPNIMFDDTDDEDCSPVFDWRIFTTGGDSDSSTENGFFLLAARDEPGCTTQISTEIIAIHTDGGSDSRHSIVVNDNGSIGLAGNSAFIDDANNRVGIGTIAPAEELEIQSTTPRFYFDDSSASSADFSIGENSGDFTLEIETNGTGGPVGEVFTLDSSTGYIGIYDFAPKAPLTVHSPDNQSAKVLVENATGSTAARTLLELRNPGNTKFSLTNTDANVEWAFANPGTGFRVSRQGSGVVEFDFLNNGDLVIAGALTENSDRNAKTEIVDIDAQAILNKVTGLPIKQWQYKDALGENHIGPMAQDFYAAFGLGKDETGIATLDSSGVALAAIQALAEKYRQINHQNMALVEDNQYKRQRIDQLQQHVNQLLSDNQALKQSQREVLSAYHQQQATQNTQQRQLQQLQAHLQQLSQQLPQSLLTQQ